MLFIVRFYEVLRGDDLRCHDIRAKGHHDLFRRSRNIKAITFNKLRVCNVGITDGRNL
jgi:hypothetical protein